MAKNIKDWCPYHERPVDGSLNSHWKAVCYRCDSILTERPEGWEKLAEISLKKDGLWKKPDLTLLKK